MANSPEGLQLAAWDAEVYGLHWIKELLKAGKAIDLGSDGYPYRYTAKAENLVPRIIAEPPGARQGWSYKIYDTQSDNWKDGTVDLLATTDYRPDEWLLIEAWDQS